MVYCEQSSHHPPASNFQVLPKDDAYRLYGYGIFSAHWKGNVIHGLQKGPNVVEFPDGTPASTKGQDAVLTACSLPSGTKITMELPFCIFKGLIWGDRIQDYGGCFSFIDKKNDLAYATHESTELVGFMLMQFMQMRIDVQP